MTVGVYIIESVGAKDLLDERSEGEGLARLLKLLGAQPVLRKVERTQDLVHELQVFDESRCDILHVSCHGNSDGIQLTDGTFLEWDEFAEYLTPAIHRKYLCLSSCQAASSSELVDIFRTNPDCKPISVAGCPSSILWHHSFVAWSIYYSRLLSGSSPYDDMRDALAAICLATGADFCLDVFLNHPDVPEVIQLQAGPELGRVRRSHADATPQPTSVQ